MHKTEKLRHGGVMANNRCTAACRHCLYACSPTRGDGYITEDTAKSVAALLIEGGCRSVHIGGGEPFLDFDKLVVLVKTLTDSGVSVEYIETNAYWATSRRIVVDRVRALTKAGAGALCVSLDPFHAEYVPVERPLLVAEVCRNNDFGHFIWQNRYIDMLSKIDDGKPHDRATIEREVSPDYVWETATNYGLHIGGRAINIETEFIEGKLVEEVISPMPCRGLLSGGHFHVDMRGHFVPPGCTGIAIPLEEAVRGISASKYPAFDALLSGGVEALFAYAKKQGFVVGADSEFTSTCALCFHIRHWLSQRGGCPELVAEHYTESLMYYDEPNPA
jgi:hypothetical protein